MHLLAALAFSLHALGMATAVHAVLKTRTSQGAIAWAFGLVTLPYVSLPLYWVFGRDRFMGYVKARREEGAQISGLRKSLAARTLDAASLPAGDPALYGVFDQLAHMPFVTGNDGMILAFNSQGHAQRQTPAVMARNGKRLIAMTREIRRLLADGEAGPSLGRR